MIMASQTKVEPVEEASPPAAPNAAGNAGGTAMGRGNDDVEDDEPAHSAMAAASLAADDEDVSIDELLISDGTDDDDEDDATEVHEGLHRVAMQEIGAMEMADAAEAPMPADIDEPESAAVSVELEALSVEGEAVSSEAASSSVELEDLEATPFSEERLSAAAEPTLTSVEPAVADADESPEAAAARATAEQEAVAVAAELARGEKPSDPVGSILVSDDAIERDEPVVPELTPDTLDARSDAAAEPTPPSLDDDKEESEAELESVRADASDAPLPSFDIPEMEAGSNGSRSPLALAPEVDALADTHAPLAAAGLAQLSEEADEDDEDAVTHIGLPVPEGAPEYPSMPGSGFDAAEPAVAARSGFDPAHMAIDARRAKTRVIRRVEPAQLPPGGAGQADTADRRADTMRPLSGTARQAAVSNWFGRFLRRRSNAASVPFGDGVSTSSRRIGWLIDNVLPPLSLILFGSAIGAFIMLLQESGAKSGQSQTVQALKESSATAKRPTTLLERAEAGDGDALFKITNMAPNERTSALTLALEAGSRAQKLNEFNEFSKGLTPPPNEIGSVLVGRIYGYATSPETMLPTFQLLSQWTGPRGPDVMYAIWEKAGSSRAASLAQELLHSADQRAKATPALSAAVDLRAATTCDDYLAVLPAVVRSGDQRCVAALRTLKHTDGCGDDGKQDCYACLRDGNQLDEALAAVEKRPAPSL